MKKVVKYLSLVICSFIIFISYAKAASYDVSITSETVTVGNSVTLTIKGNDLAGRFDLSSSNNSILSLSSSSLFIDNTSSSITITTKSVGTATITITPTDVTAYDSSPVTGNKSVTITVKEKATSNPSTGGNSSGTSNYTSPTKKKSTNNYLSNLTVEGYELDSAFKKDKEEYSITVENDVKSIKINAQLDDSSAKVEGIGEVNVKEGINKLEVKVTAEDGSVRTYILNVTVKELDAIEVTVDKKKYTIIRTEDVLEPPSNYEKSTIKIGDQDVLCYKNKITKNILIGLKSEDGTARYYLYDEKTKSYTKYLGYKFGELNLCILDMPKDKLPNNYIKKTFTYGEDKIDGYVLKNGSTDFYLFYGQNELTGKKSLYIFDKSENTVQRFNDDLSKVYKKKANNYFIGLIVVGTILSAIFITLLVIWIKKKKESPRINHKRKTR